jgi:hypothetical protein
VNTLFGVSTLATGVAGVKIAATAGDGAGGEPNVKGVPFDGAAGFAGSAAGDRSGGTLGGGAGADSPGFAGAPNVKGGARDGVVVVGFSPSFGNVRDAAKVEEAAAESGIGVANADMGRDGAPNSDGVAPAAFGTFCSGTLAGFDRSTTGTVSNEGGAAMAAGLSKTEELAKKLGIPEDVGAALDADAVVAGASERTLAVSGVGGTSDILGRAGAGVRGSGIEATFAISVLGGAGTGAGLVRENGSEVIGGSVARVRSCAIVVYAV